jgi:peptide/nickel transport system substrate-binding protein
MVLDILSGLHYHRQKEPFLIRMLFRYPYDLAKAKKILTDDGFIDRDNDGVHEDKNGQMLNFFYYKYRENVRRKIAKLFRRSITLGFKVHFQPLNLSLIQKMIIHLDLTQSFLDLLYSDPHFGINVWHSSGHCTCGYPRQKKPSTDWSKNRQPFGAGVKEIDIEKRKTIYREWQRITAENLPLIYTVKARKIYAFRTGS